MIHPLNNAKLETGIRAYVVARFAALSLTVPAPDGSASVSRVAPVVIASTSAAISPENQPWVAIVVPATPADGTGLYGDQMPVSLVTVCPFPYPPGITESDHAALATALAACFISRPAFGAPGYDADFTAWQARNAALSEAVEDATGYWVNGWFLEGSRTVRTKDRIEDILTMRPCVYHPDVA